MGDLLGLSHQTPEPLPPRPRQASPKEPTSSSGSAHFPQPQSDSGPRNAQPEEPAKVSGQKKKQTGASAKQANTQKSAPTPQASANPHPQR